MIANMALVVSTVLGVLVGYHGYAALVRWSRGD